MKKQEKEEHIPYHEGNFKARDEVTGKPLMQNVLNKRKLHPFEMDEYMVDEDLYE